MACLFFPEESTIASCLVSSLSLVFGESTPASPSTMIIVTLFPINLKTAMTFSIAVRITSAVLSFNCVISVHSVGMATHISMVRFSSKIISASNTTSSGCGSPSVPTAASPCRIPSGIRCLLPEWHPLS